MGNAEQVSIAGSDLSLLGVELGMGENYNLLIPRGTIADAAGNTVETRLMFTTTDSSNPTFMSSTPANDSFVAEIPATVSLVFSENITIDASTIQTEITISGGEAGGSESIGTVAVNAENAAQLDIAVSGLADNTRYTITVQSSAITDAAGNALQENVVLRFTPDSTAPVFEADMSTPANNATVSAIPSTASLVFSENIAIDASTIQTEITISGGEAGGSESIGTVVVNAENANQLDIAVSGLADNTRYTITVPRTALRDRAGNMPASDSEIMFSIDTDRPVFVESASVADNISTNTAPVSLHFEFSENIRIANASSITLTGGAGSVASSATGTRLELMVSGVVHGMYSISIGNNAITDSAGNTLAAPISRNFAFDSMPPDFASALPSRSSGQITISFNEDIRLIPGSGESITLYEGATSVDTFALNNGAQVEVSGRTITLSMVTLTERMTYTIAIPAAIVRDSVGNPNAEITRESNRISFTITDTTAPMPVNNSVTVNNSFNEITITFAEAIALANGETLLTLAEGIGITNTAGTEVTTPFTAAIAGADNTNLVLSLDSALPLGEVYTIAINSDLLADVPASNALTPANTNEALSIPVDLAPPALVDDNPATVSINEHFNINADRTELTLAFNEPISIINQPSLASSIRLERTRTDGSTERISIVSTQIQNTSDLVIGIPPLEADVYTLTIPADSLRDTANNNAGEVAGTIDLVPPALSDALPVVNATREEITLAFTEAIALANGETLLTLAEGIGIVNAAGTEVTTPFTAAIAGADNTNLVISLDSALPTGAVYTIAINSDLLADVPASNALTPANTNGALSVTVDLVPPVLVDDNPATTDTNEQLRINADRTEITLSFSENISIVSGTMPADFALSELSAFDTGTMTEVPAPVTITIATATVADLVLTVDTADALKTGRYSLSIPAGAVQDAAGNQNAAVMPSFTVDTVPGAPQRSVPPSTNTARTQVTVTFNEEIRILNSATIANEITVQRSDGTQSFATTDVALNTERAALVITTAAFAGENEVTVTIGANVLSDAAGNPYAGETVALDLSPPRIDLAAEDTVVINGSVMNIRFTKNISIAPGVPTTNVPDTRIDIDRVDADGNNIGNTRNIDIAISASDPTILEISSNIGRNFVDSNYEITIGAGIVRDKSLNPNPAQAPLRFAQDTTAPTLRESTIATNATGTTTLSLVFSDRTDPISGVLVLGTETISLVDSVDLSSAISITGGPASAITPAGVDSASLSASGNTLTIPLTNLVETNGMNYTISINPGTLQDASGNRNAALQATLIVDTTEPVEPTAQIDSTGGRITLTFSENIDIVTGITAGQFTLSTATAVTRFIDSTNPNEIILELASPLGNGAYTLTIPANAVVNSAGNQNSSALLASFNVGPRPASATATFNAVLNQITLAFTGDIRLASGTSTDGSDFTLTNDRTTSTVAISAISEPTATAPSAPTSSNLVLTVPALETANYTLTIPANVLEDSTGTGNPAGSATFAVDTVPGGPNPIPEFPVSVNSTRDQITVRFTESIFIANEAGIRLTGTGGAGFGTTPSITPTTSGRDLILSLSALVEGDRYRLDIDAGAITDGVGNGNARMSGTSTGVTFTVDTIAPALVASTTTNPNPTINLSGTEITLAFNENISIANEAGISLAEVTTPAGMETTTAIDLANTNGLSVEENTNLVLRPSSALSEGTVIRITITTGSISDNAGNSNTTNITTENFTVVTPLSITGIVATASSSIEITFSENISLTGEGLNAFGQISVAFMRDGNRALTTNRKPTINGSVLSISSSGLNIAFTLPPGSTGVTVTLPAGVIDNGTDDTIVDGTKVNGELTSPEFTLP